MVKFHKLEVCCLRHPVLVPPVGNVDSHGHNQNDNNDEQNHHDHHSRADSGHNWRTLACDDSDAVSLINPLIAVVSVSYLASP